MAKLITIADVQKRIDPLPASMSAKGLRQPNAQITITANSEMHGHLSWKDKREHYGSVYEFARGKTAAEILGKMEAFIAKLPAPEETRMKEFMAALSQAIDLGRENGIAVEFINPLTEAMQRLSNNILTDQRSA